MLKRLSIEWMKLKSYRTFWILTILYLLCITGINYIAYYIQQKIYQAREAKGMAQMLIGHIPYSYPTVWQMTAYISSYLLFFPGLLMIIIMTNEYSYKTHRQNIIDGWSRWQFISVKMFQALLLAIISTIVVILTAILFGTIEGSESFSTDHFIYIWYYFIQALSYVLAALLISVLLKRGGLAIGIYFLYVVVVETVLKFVLNYFFDTAGRYLPLKASSELIPAPLFERVQRQFSSPLNYPALLITSALYLFAYFYLTMKKFQTDDL